MQTLKEIFDKVLIGTRAIFLLIAFVISSFSCSAQCLATFQDINNRVYVFDGSQFIKIEKLPLESFTVGRNIMAYITQDHKLKVFYKGKVFPLNNGSHYQVTDNWMVYSYNGASKVLYNDEFKILGTYPDITIYKASDSIIEYGNAKNYFLARKLFYNGEIQSIEGVSTARPTKLGDNIYAFVGVNGQFKIFYHGQVQTLENYEPLNYLLDRDIVLYIDQYGKIKFFQNGNLYETQTPMPEQYWIGEGFGVYISPVKTLVVFYNGKETTLMEDIPVDIKVKENLIVYSDRANNFRCWHKGKSYLLENYIPKTYQVEKNIIVYPDINGRLKAFYYGEQIQVSDQIVAKFKLFIEAVTYSVEPYQTKVWCNKKTYTFE